MENMLTTYEKVNELVIADPCKAVNAIDESVKALKTFDEKVAFIGSSAIFGRAQWVQTSIVVARAFEGLSRKEMTPKVESLQSKMLYSRAHVYNLRKAGEKLLSEAKLGTLKNVPYTLTEYLQPEKSEPVNKQSLIDIVKAGEYKTADDEKMLIYRGKLKTSDGKDTVKYFTVPAGFTLKDGGKIEIAYEAKIGKDGVPTGKEHEVYTAGDKRIDVQIVNL